MSKKDNELIKSMVSVQKKPSKREENVPSLINRIIHIIRKKDRPCTLAELEKETKEKDLGKNKRFMNELMRSAKIRYDDRTDMISLKSKYGISNIEELKAKIRESENGLPEDDELKDVYPGVKNDIERLKAENYVKVIENEDKSNVLFFRDTSDKVEKKLIDPDYQPAIELLRKIWRDELRHYDLSEKNQVYIKKRRPSHDLKIKGQKRRKITKRANEHILFDILNKPTG